MPTTTVNVATSDDFDVAVRERAGAVFIRGWDFPALRVLEWVTALTLCGCGSVPAVPTLEFLRELYVVDCPALGAVEPQPALVRLELVRCPLVSRLLVFVTGRSAGRVRLDRFAADNCGKLVHVPPAHAIELTSCFNVRLGTQAMACARSITVRACGRLVRVPSAPHLAEAEFCRCPSLAHVGPNFPVLARLRLATCPSLTHLPPRLPALTKLVISNDLAEVAKNGWEAKLAHIPAYPLLDWLCIDDCPGITRIEGQPRVTSMFLKNCGSAPPFPLPRLERLVMHSMAQNMQYAYPVLDELDLFDCTNILRLPRQPRLRSLFLSGCTNLETVFSCPGLTSLEVRECHGVTDPGVHPALERLVLSGCAGLRTIAHTYARLVHLHIESCPRLAHGAPQPRLAEVRAWYLERPVLNVIRTMTSIPPGRWSYIGLPKHKQ